MNYIEKDQLQPRRAYRLKSRNLLVGVWDPESDGFIGVRQKFGDKYLFTEYFYGETWGTAHAVEALDFSLAPGVVLDENIGSFCQKCDEPVYGKPGVRDGREVQCIGNFHVTESDCEAEGTYCAYMKRNKDLFDLLLPWDTLFNEERLR